jgi:hypothetical protein
VVCNNKQEETCNRSVSENFWRKIVQELDLRRYIYLVSVFPEQMDEPRTSSY